jgi:hypothetical protein
VDSELDITSRHNDVEMPNLLRLLNQQQRAAIYRFVGFVHGGEDSWLELIWDELSRLDSKSDLEQWWANR